MCLLPRCYPIAACGHSTKRLTRLPPMPVFAGCKAAFAEKLVSFIPGAVTIGP